MLFHGSLLFSLFTVVASGRHARGLADRVVQIGFQLSAPKLTKITVPDVDTYLNYTGRIGANFTAKNLSLHGLEKMKIKNLQLQLIPPALERISLSCDQLLLEGNYSIKGTSYGAFKGPLDASGPFKALLRLVSIDFGATLDYKKFPRIQIKDIFLLDVFVISSKIQVDNFFEDKKKQADFNEYVSGLIPQFINEGVENYNAPIKKLINKKLL